MIEAILKKNGERGERTDAKKSKEEADSPVARYRIWNWYRTVARTRLQPDAAIVLIMTRWHKDDLAGRILKRQ